MRTILRSAFPLVLVLLMACGDAGTGTETPRAVVTSGPTDIELIPGGSRYIVYSVERIAGHSGAVQLSVTGVPEGVLARFHPPVVTSDALVSSLEVTVSPTATSGTHTFNTVANGPGVQSTSIPVTVTIVVPGVSLTSGSSSIVFEQGKSASAALNVSRSGGFTGVVGLTLTGVPPGVTATLGSSALQGGESTTTLAFAAALDAPIGNFAVTVTAASSLQPGHFQFPSLLRRARHRVCCCRHPRQRPQSCVECRRRLRSTWLDSQAMTVRCPSRSTGCPPM